MDKPVRAVKFGTIKKNAYLEQIRQGCGRFQAAGNVGISYETVRNHFKRDSTFAEQIDLAEMAQAEVVENALFKKCKEGNVTAIIFYLQNRRSDRWADKRGPQVEKVSEMGKEQLEAECRARGIITNETPGEAF